MYYIYAVYNREKKKIYIGQTENLDERLRLHNSHEFKGSFTANLKGSWKLIYKETVNSRKEALIREKQLKSYQGRLFVKKYIPL